MAIKLFSSLKNNSPTIGGNTGGAIMAARCQYCVLDEKTNPEAWELVNGYAGIGAILYQMVNLPNPSEDPMKLGGQVAYPLFPNHKNFPLRNEIVYIIGLPDISSQANLSAIKYYYFQPINLWNTVHHNAIPNPTAFNDKPAAQKQTYKETELGNPQRVSADDAGIELGLTFPENVDIRNLQPFEGDIIHEGRFGQSIRLGSTISGSSHTKNSWSDAGKEGSPIMILRNGQFKERGVDPWVPIIENINSDKSSIYLTSTQRIRLGAARSTYDSYTGAWGETPTAPSGYAGSQVILNAGRLVFNSKSDHILLTANRTISFNSNKGFNFDTDANFVVKVGTTINLGARKDQGGDEPVILGNKFLDDFEKLLDKLIEFTTVIKEPIGQPFGGPPIPSIPPRAIALQASVQTMKNKIQKYKSEITFTK
tara:strand:+ start:1189 stop:2460 length:1272 start_codon:yes stop_codon:yes gene_type:complete